MNLDQEKLDDAFHLLEEPQPKAYYWRDGWSFERRSGGIVEIVKRSSARPDSNVELRVVVPPSEWAQVVCQVSSDGMNVARWNEATRFHGKS